MLILSRKVNEGFTSGILSISKGSRSTVMQLRSESRRPRAFIVEPDHRVEAFPEGRLSAHFLAPQPAAGDRGLGSRSVRRQKCRGARFRRLRHNQPTRDRIYQFRTRISKSDVRGVHCGWVKNSD